MSDAVDASPVERAKEALARHSWREAFDLLSTEDAAGRLAPAELDLLAQAAWWVGRLPVAIDARERAYAATRAHDNETAARVAITLAHDHLFRNAAPVANAWLRRAERILEHVDEGVGHGWLAATQSFHDAVVGDEAGALANATRALEIGRRLQDRDLETFGLAGRGAALVSSGRVAEGLDLVDEASVAAISGELDPAVAQVEIALAASDSVTARTAAEEIGRIAEQFGTRLPAATAAAAIGAVEASEGALEEARRDLQRAVDLYSVADAPCEVAVGRRGLAEVHAAAGDPDAAIVEARAAREAFEHLGAAPDLRRTARLLVALEAATDPRAVDGVRANAGAGAERVLRTFVFTDIVDSTKLTELLGDESWSRVLHWHDQALRGVVAEHGGEEIKATGDGFFLAFDDVDQAIDAALGIQRRLEDQRRENGFAPQVRIGVHRSEARRTGLDYIGGGVNLAARIGKGRSGFRGAGERRDAGVVEASRRARRPSVGPAERLPEPVDVASVGWR